MAIPPDPFNRKPWPMKWIVVAIFACIIPYTWLTIAYRKEAPAHQPYQDNKDRAQVLRLLENGFSRMAVPLEILADPSLPSVRAGPTEALPGGLPPLLDDLLIDRPTLPPEFPAVIAPAASLSGEPYVFSFLCAQGGHDEPPVPPVLYHRQSQLVIIIGHADTPAEPQTRKLTQRAQITLPADTLEPGEYQLTLVGAQESRRWTLTVH